MRAQGADRLARTPFDKLGRDDLKRITHYWLSQESHFAENTRNLVASLTSWFGLLRGESARRFEFADMFSDIVQSDPTASEMMQCRALFFVMMNGKTNQFNHLEYAAMLRAKEVDACCVGSVALYLFLRFHCTNESFPDLDANTDWFNIKVWAYS